MFHSLIVYKGLGLGTAPLLFLPYLPCGHRQLNLHPSWHKRNVVSCSVNNQYWHVTILSLYPVQYTTYLWRGYQVYDRESLSKQEATWIEPDLNLVNVVDCVVEFDWLTLRRGRLRAVDVAERLANSLVGLDLGDGRGVGVVEVERRRNRHWRWSCLGHNCRGHCCGHVVTTVLNYCSVRPETVTHIA